MGPYLHIALVICLFIACVVFFFILYVCVREEREGGNPSVETGSDCSRNDQWI